MPHQIANESDLTKVEDRRGKCFELTGIFIMNHPEWNLVHAANTDYMFKTGISRVYAWVEKEDAAFDDITNSYDRLVYDVVFDREYQAWIFYAMYGIISCHSSNYRRRHKIPEPILVRYTGKQALRHIKSTLTYGPWDEQIKMHIDVLVDKK